MIEAVERGGIVWIVWSDEPEPARYQAHWEGDAANGLGLIETMPDARTLEVALGWASERCDKVIVRPEWDPETEYSAGPSSVGRPPLSIP